MNVLAVDIFESKNFGNCSNSGISSKFDKILVEHPQGPITIDENDPPENLCRIETRFGYKYLRPVKDADNIGWMHGGCICYSSDSRFRELSEYPLCLHDRQESQELYNILSS